MIVFAVFGATMFALKIAMAAIPNIHPLGMFIMLLTIVYRWRALIPIYIYVMLDGLYSGFGTWWIPYLYIWAILWAITMLLPRRMPRAVKAVVYPVVCGLFGIAFGALYAPVWAIIAGFNFEQTMAWIAAGLSFDILHAIGNASLGCLVLPLSEVLLRLDKGSAGKNKTQS